MTPEQYEKIAVLTYALAVGLTIAAGNLGAAVILCLISAVIAAGVASD